MIILGIDPGTASTGYGVIALSGGKMEAVDYGVISTPAGQAAHLRLKLLHEGLIAVFARFGPAEISIEQLFFSNNAKTALAVGEARGVALLAAASTGCPLGEYTPLQVKQAVVGYGLATKSQVQYMVKAILSLTEEPKPDDAADALALAICHAHSRRAPVPAGRARR
jgi:crossover junction endodeoxyribonuclease RuvC